MGEDEHHIVKTTFPTFLAKPISPKLLLLVKPETVLCAVMRAPVAQRECHARSAHTVQSFVCR